MGNCLAVNLGCDPIISRCWDCAAGQGMCFCQLEDILQVLQTERDELMALKTDVMRRVIAAEEPEMERLAVVENWRIRVEVLISEVDILLPAADKETSRLCFGGCCSKNCKSTYSFMKKVDKKLKQVVDQKTRGNFAEVVQTAGTKPVEQLNIGQTVGLENMLDKSWKFLMEAQVETLGIWGMGGVGKTTLLTQINNKFLHTDHDFEVVIWVKVPRDCRIEDVQAEIWKKLGFSIEKIKDKVITERAQKIFNYLHEKKFVLLLDDLQRPLDLRQVGIPLLQRQNKSKVVFTTRYGEVCPQMRARNIEIRPLNTEQAWKLFQEMVGEDLDEEIRVLARKIAGRCSGLPIAIVVVARAMAGKKSYEEWDHALDILENSALNLQGMEVYDFVEEIEEEVFNSLKFSYDSLPNDNIRSCFLYCALFPEGFHIFKDDLIHYWISEDFCALKEGYDVIGILVRACLLEEDGKYVKMHDIVRAMALWIALKFTNDKAGKFSVKAGRWLFMSINFIDQWEEVRRVSWMQNCIERLQKVPTCPDLLTVFLQDNFRLYEICDGFFRSMCSLKVLDLSNCGIKLLPEDVSQLVSLQYLNLSNTLICRIPVGLKNLVKLKYLNLEHTFHLPGFPNQVISELSWLKVLKFFVCSSLFENVNRNSIAGWSAGIPLAEELRNLEHLDFLTITIGSGSAFQIYSSSPKLLNCTRVLSVEADDSKCLDISSFASMKQLEKLHFCYCKILEEISTAESVMEGSEKQLAVSLYKSAFLEKVCFNKLREVLIADCYQLLDLTWLVLVPNLAVLTVRYCRSMKQIINVEKLRDISVVAGNLEPFGKLEAMELGVLRGLESIHPDPLPFPFLKVMEVYGCSNLTKLPLNSDSGRKGSKIFIQGETSWWNSVEWDDDTTKEAFSLRLLSN